jgi:hypothetical protein
MKTRRAVGIILLVLVLVGCGGGSFAPPVPQNADISGQWAVQTTSTQAQPPAAVYANIVSQGGGSFYSDSSNVEVCPNNNPVCFAYLPPVGQGCGFSACALYTLMATVSGSKVTLTLTGTWQNGSVTTTQATGTVNGSTITGTYTSSGGGVSDGGSFVATKQGTVAGNYTGTLQSQEYATPPFNVSAAITEAASGTLGGTAMVTNSSCASSVTFNSGFNASIGGALILSGSGGVSVFAVPTTGTSYSVLYTFTSCADTGTGTVTRQ